MGSLFYKQRYFALFLFGILLAGRVSSQTVPVNSTSVESFVWDFNHILEEITDKTIALQSPLVSGRILQTYHALYLDNHSFKCSYTFKSMRGQDTISTQMWDVYKNINWQKVEGIRLLTTSGEYSIISIEFRAGVKVKRVHNFETGDHKKREVTKNVFLFLPIPTDQVETMTVRLNKLSSKVKGLVAKNQK